MSALPSKPPNAPTSPAEAVACLQAALSVRPGFHRVNLADAAGLILAETARTDRPHPAAALSAMDGFAIQFESLRAGPIPVSATVRIGQNPPTLVPESAARIVTGGGVPAGANVVIKREDVRESADGTWIELSEHAMKAVVPGQHMRATGENAPQAAVIAEAGAVITPPLAGALATFGYAQPLVYRPLRIAVVLTGDELLGVSEAPTPYQIRESNGHTLSASLGRYPYLAMESIRTAGDDLVPTTKALVSALEAADAVVLTGGVSMGDRDCVPDAIRSLGGRIVFHKLPQRPGRPILAAVMPGGQPVFGLPGNPLSTLVTTRRIVLPVLAHVAGARRLPAPMLVSLTFAINAPIAMWWHRLVRIVDPGLAELIDLTGSGDVPAAATSDGFVEVAPRAVGTGPFAFYAW